jgi:hypothetical protein
MDRGRQAPALGGRRRRQPGLCHGPGEGGQGMTSQPPKSEEETMTAEPRPITAEEMREAKLALRRTVDHPGVQRRQAKPARPGI